MPNRANRSLVPVVVVVCLVIVGLIALLRFIGRRHAPEVAGPSAPPTAPARAPGRVLPLPPGPLPLVSVKPEPIEITFDGCPPEGDNQRQAELNRGKNRVDEGEYVPVAFDAVAGLTWPQGVERQKRENWAAADVAVVDRYQGLPVAIEGYLAGAKQEGTESPNCHGDDAKYRDFHIWLTQNPNEDRSKSIVVEVTPRVRANHPNWRTDVLGQIVKKDQRVRISGWLLLDPEHPDQVGKTRATIWEIHPIMQIEVQQQGQWIPLDKLGS
ncbi:MAG: hypothetical protein ACJ74W_25210 [Pyrinomonadaceae bacterium]